MIQNGGWLVSKNGKKATVNSAANVQAFNYVKKMLGNGSMKLTNQLGVGWGGEGFGKKMCAMTIEGNWIAGAMKNDYPSVGYKVVQLPHGPKSQGTLQYDGGWGLAAASKNKADAMNLISWLTSPEHRAGHGEGVRRHAVDHVGEEEVAEGCTRSGRPSSPARITRRASRRSPESRRFSATSTSSCRRSRTRTRRRSSTGSMRSCRRFSSDPLPAASWSRRGHEAATIRRNRR